jgi:hypothetical protein
MRRFFERDPGVEAFVMVARRDFLAALPALMFAPSLINREAAAVRIALIYSPEYANAARAAEMSAGEVRRAAALLKREFHFQAIATEARGPRDDDWTGVILATPHSAISAADPTINIGNVACGANVLALRSPFCRGAPCVLWHSSLERFGAAQLNDRFRAARIPIDEQAWLGWFAVKVLWDAGVRGKHPRELSYDGHKGKALRFNSHGLLIQPVYRLDGQNNVTEVQPDAAWESSECGS